MDINHFGSRIWKTSPKNTWNIVFTIKFLFEYFFVRNKGMSESNLWIVTFVLLFLWKSFLVTMIGRATSCRTSQFKMAAHRGRSFGDCKIYCYFITISKYSAFLIVNKVPKIYDSFFPALCKSTTWRDQSSTPTWRKYTLVDWSYTFPYLSRSFSTSTSISGSLCFCRGRQNVLKLTALAEASSETQGHLVGTIEY